MKDPQICCVYCVYGWGGSDRQVMPGMDMTWQESHDTGVWYYEGLGRVWYICREYATGMIQGYGTVGTEGDGWFVYASQHSPLLCML